MTEQEYDEIDLRLEAASDLRDRIWELRDFIDSKWFAMWSASAGVMLTQKQDDGNVVQQLAFDMPFSELQPFLLEYAKKELAKRLSELEAI